jgi:hypothetical protein
VAAGFQPAVPQVASGSKWPQVFNLRNPAWCAAPLGPVQAGRLQRATAMDAVVRIMSLCSKPLIDQVLAHRDD